MGLQHKSRVILPPGMLRQARADVISVCTVITGPQNPATGDYPVCGAAFLKGQERLVESHGVDCAVKHAEWVRAFFEQRRPRIMRTWDTELADYIARNKDALLEGRKKL